MLCGSLDGRAIGERMDTCVCMAESFCCPPETVTTLLTDYTPTQKVFKKVTTMIHELFLKNNNTDFASVWISSANGVNKRSL